jgi:HNH endonuclease
MTNLSEDVRKLVRQQAKDSCEYCLSHQRYILGRLQIDHIQPVAKGGSDFEDNLCLACELCNQYKWTQTEGIDLETGEKVFLFNPRQQKWTDHFDWSEDSTQIIGKTDCGRATVNALKLNNFLAVTVRQNWIQAGWHPPSSL